MKHKILNITLIALSSLSITQPTFAAPECDAILQHGIFDKSNILDQESKFNMVKDTYCSSSSKNSELNYADSSVDLGLSHAETEQLCKSNFQQAMQNSNYKSVISTASATIANAWQACIRDNKGGLSHYIQPTADKSQFTYKIIYTPDGDPPDAHITSWDISNGASCKRPPTSGQSINSGGYESQCTRNPNQSVIITVNADRGTKNLKTLELPPYRAFKEESNKSVNKILEAIKNGAYEQRPSGEIWVTPLGEKTPVVIYDGNQKLTAISVCRNGLFAGFSEGAVYFSPDGKDIGKTVYEGKQYATKMWCEPGQGLDGTDSIVVEFSEGARFRSLDGQDVGSGVAKHTTRIK